MKNPKTTLPGLLIFFIVISCTLLALFKVATPIEALAFGSGLSALVSGYGLVKAKDSDKR